MIKHIYLNGIKPQKTIDDFKKYLGTPALSDATTYNLCNKFEHDYMGTQAEPLFGQKLSLFIKKTSKKSTKNYKMTINLNSMK